MRNEIFHSRFTSVHQLGLVQKTMKGLKLDQVSYEATHMDHPTSWVICFLPKHISKEFDQKQSSHASSFMCSVGAESDVFTCCIVTPGPWLENPCKSQMKQNTSHVQLNSFNWTSVHKVEYYLNPNSVSASVCRLHGLAYSQSWNQSCILRNTKG